MNTKNSNAFTRLERRPLVIGLALVLAVTGASIATDAAAATLPVTNCNDSGSGSLRDTVAAALSGDTLDLHSQLQCSTITLTSGAIVVNQHDLSLIGPAGGNRLTIDGSRLDRVIKHGGSGTLTLTDLAIANGKYQSSSNPRGGCLYSYGAISLTHSTVSNCAAEGQGSARAYGGGIFAHRLYLTDSNVSGNTATAADSAFGGGAAAGLELHAQSSTISFNEASTTGSDTTALGGGLMTEGFANVVGSTISGNKAAEGAGWAGESFYSGQSVTIVNSTISGNIASNYHAGITTTAPLALYNSTIAFNSGGIAGFSGAGLYSFGAALTLQSSIIADNIDAAGNASDLAGAAGTAVTGANNLITSGHGVVFPPNTITTCPKLGPLADNGGSTQTHALLHTSFAIDTGINPANLIDDQRGSTYPRVFGFAADIGAYEWQGMPDDRLFVSGFEMACDH